MCCLSLPESRRRDATRCNFVRHRLRLIGVTTCGGASTFGFAVLLASNWLAFRNITLQRLQAKKGVS